MTTKTMPAWRIERDALLERHNQVASTVLTYVTGSPEAKALLAAYIINLGLRSGCHSYNELWEITETANIPETLVVIISDFIEQED